MEIKQSEFKLLDKFECIKILKNYLQLNDNTEFEFINFELKPITHETLGYLGEYYLLNITEKRINAEKRNHQFFVKTLPVTNQGHREIIESIGVFSKEANLYKTLFKELKKYEVLKWCPDCFYVRDDIIVMENLLNDNFRHLKKDESFLKKHIQIVLKTMASMHASCLVFEEKNGIEIGEKFKNDLFEPSFQSSSGWFKAGLQGIEYVASVHPKFQTAEYQTFIREKLIQKLNPMYEIVHSSKFRRVFCHRDIWDKNVFIKYNNKNEEPEECIFVDFQIGRYQPPAMDVILFIHLTTDRAFREIILDESLEYYYDCLKNNVKKFNINLFSWEEFKKSCDFVKLPCLVLNGVYAPLIYLSSNFMNDLKKNEPEKFNQLIDCDRIVLIKEQMNRNQFFKDSFLEIVEELVEFVKAQKTMNL